MTGEKEGTVIVSYKTICNISVSFFGLALIPAPAVGADPPTTGAAARVL
jgi:hypothetical protein